ncbi:MAG: PLP-dependent aminotransferase family protein [Lachnospiraceae bacterium]|nr:PLP-dependent aminotransferase family protein [Lachnospiraceae bacterium]
MKEMIDKSLHTPAYLQLYNYFVEKITSGAYPYGSKLPSKRTVAADMGLSVITVLHAFDLLCDEGYTESRERSGIFVIYKESDFLSSKVLPVTAKAVSTEKPSHASSGSDFPFSVLAKAMRKVLLDYGDRLLVKSPNFGCLELRNAISSYLERSRGIKVTPSQIIIGSGAEYLYGQIAQFLKFKDIAIEDPSYEKIEKVYSSMGVKCHKLPLSQNGIQSSALNSSKEKILHVTPFNSYPSGATADISKKREYLKWARENNGIIIEDNYDSELTVSKKPESPLFSLSDSEKVIYINTFSRTIAPSMRVGYMLLPASMVDDFTDKLGFYSCTVPLFEQYLLSTLIQNGDYERHINHVRRQKRKELKN